MPRRSFGRLLQGNLSILSIAHPTIIQRRFILAHSVRMTESNFSENYLLRTAVSVSLVSIPMKRIKNKFDLKINSSFYYDFTKYILEVDKIEKNNNNEK